MIPTRPITATPAGPLASWVSDSTLRPLCAGSPAIAVIELSGAPLLGSMCRGEVRTEQEDPREQEEPDTGRFEHEHDSVRHRATRP